MSNACSDEHRLYGELMNEIKVRLDAIATYLGNRPAQNDFLHAEFCLLQVRMVCEIIALAAAAAQSPRSLTKDLLKSWNADRSIGYLVEFNEHSFPRQVRFERRPQGIHLEAIQRSLTRKEFTKIYSDCGELLHRGRVRQILSLKPRVYDVRSIKRWSEKLGQLLAVHMVLLPGTDRVLLTQLNGPNENVTITILEGI